jgi:medium-chain acyl-[acyl-carrier-protein] hydrolase
MSDFSYSLELTVRPDEADRNGLCTIRSLATYLQHAAFLHADSLDFGVDSLGKNGHTWVLTRLYIRVDRPPRYGDRVTIETWPTGVDRLFALRDFRLCAADGKTLAVAASSWCIISLEARRIVRPPESLARFSSNPRAVDRDLAKIDPIRTPTPIIKNLDVRYRDIDVNRHVNNVSFIEWMCEALPYDLQSDSFCHEIEINFLKEAFLGDTVLSFAAPFTDSPLSYHHALRRKDEEEDSARAVTRWEKLNGTTPAAHS